MSPPGLSFSPDTEFAAWLWAPVVNSYLHPRQVLRELEKAMPPDVMVSTDIGNIDSVANGYEKHFPGRLRTSFER